MSKQKLTIEHLAPYLPYKLNYKRNGKFCSTTMSGLQLDVWFDDYNDESIKPILRPMSEVVEYFEEIYGTLEHQDVTDYLDADYLNDYGNLEIEDLENIEPENLTYGTLQVLLKHHFDVFGLIEKGLAINLNEVK